MKINAIKCESCDNAHNINVFGEPSELQLPPTWLVVYFAGTKDKEGYHFCSKQCLNRWLLATSPEATQPLVEAPQYSTRRFLLFNKGIVGGVFSGVKWGNGLVSLEPSCDTGGYAFSSWGKFRESYPDGPVTWIDPEVKGGVIAPGMWAIVGESQEVKP